jgi:hypothetical protein
MQTDLVWEHGPGKLRDLQVIVQKLDELASAGPDLLRLRGLFDRIEMKPDMVHAATRRSDDRVELFEAIDKESLGSSGIVLATTVSHRLPAAGLIERVLDRAAEPFEEFKRRNADLRKKGVDIARNEESDLHRRVPPIILKSATGRLIFTEYFIGSPLSITEINSSLAISILLSNFLNRRLKHTAQQNVLS